MVLQRGIVTFFFEIMENSKDIYKSNGSKNIAILIFALLFVKGFIFIFLIPLWQGPDEPTHIEYVMRLSQHQHNNLFDINVESDKRIRERILISMKSNDFERFGARVMAGDISPILGSAYPPVYYFINSFLIKIFNIHSFEDQIYFMRLLSMICGVGNVLLIYLIANRVVSDADRLFPIAAASFAGFLPQYSYMTATVNPENLSNLIITAAIFVCFLTFDNGLRWHYVLSLIILLLMGYLTKKTIFIILPLVFPIFFIHSMKRFIDYKNQLHRHIKIIIFAILILAVSFIIIKLLPNGFLYKAYWQGADILRSFNNVLMLALNHPILYIKETAILFVSFWLTFGYMVYKMSIGWYILLFVITCLSIFGFSRVVICVIRDKKWHNCAKTKGTVMFVSLIIVNFTAIFFDEFKNYSSQDIAQTYKPLYAQGRYLFPSLSAISCLFVLGIKNISPDPYKTTSINLVTIFMMFLNAVSIFKYLIPIYYL